MAYFESKLQHIFHHERKVMLTGAGYITFPRQEAEGDECPLFDLLSLLVQSRPLMVLLLFRVDLPTSVSLIKMIPHWHPSGLN